MRYQIVGEPLSAVICDVEAGETLITERGSMSRMTPNMKTETTSGGVGKALGRMFAGEALFNTVIRGPGHIILQTMPISAVAGSLRAFFPSSK